MTTESLWFPEVAQKAAPTSLVLSFRRSANADFRNSLIHLNKSARLASSSVASWSAKVLVLTTWHDSTLMGAALSRIAVW